jgi:hypothetical protein
MAGRTSRASRSARARRVWVPIAVALVPAAAFLLVGVAVRLPNGVPYGCPSAVSQLIQGPGMAIKPTVVLGDIRTYDPRDESLWHEPEAWRVCREKNTQAAAFACVIMAGGVGIAAAGQRRPRRRPEAPSGGHREPRTR